MNVPEAQRERAAHDHRQRGRRNPAFVYQMMTGAAFGYDTLRLEATDPKRVMFIDVENNELQTKRNVQGIVPTLRSGGPTWSLNGGGSGNG